MRSATLSGLVVVLPTLCASGQIVYRSVVRDQQVPDHNAMFTNLDPRPVINSNGTVMFGAEFYPPVSPRYTGFWTEQGGTISPVVVTGDQAPSPSPTGAFSRTFGASLTNTGVVAFNAETYGSSVYHVGVWTRQADGYHFVVRDDNVPPGLPGVTYSGPGDVVLNDAGTLFFGSLLTGPSVTNANNIALFRDAGAGPALIARTGEQAPGMPVGHAFRSFDAQRMNAAGSVIFSATTIDSQSNVTRGVWSDRTGTLQPVIRAGDQTPGGAQGQTVVGISRGHLSNSGRVVVSGSSTGGPGGTIQGCIWSDRDGPMTTLVRGGDSAGPGITFRSLGLPVSNEASRIAFTASFQGAGVGSVNQNSLWTDAPGPLTMVARGGQHAPGTGSIPVFLNFESPLLNNRGQIAFVASLFGSTINSNNDQGIWATDLQGTLTLIAREGDFFDVNPDPIITELRQISTLSMLGGRDAIDPLGTAFNDSGQLVFSLGFTDSTQGIYVATIPSPAATPILASVAWIACARRRKPS